MVAFSGTAAPDINPSRKSPLYHQTTIYAHEPIRWPQDTATFPASATGDSEARHIRSNRIGPSTTQTSTQHAGTSSSSNTSRRPSHSRTNSNSRSNNTNTAVATTRGVHDIDGFSGGSADSYASGSRNSSVDLGHNSAIHTATATTATATVVRRIGPAQRRNTDTGPRIDPAATTNTSSPLRHNAPPPSFGSPGGTSASPSRYARNDDRESPYTWKKPPDLNRPRGNAHHTANTGASSLLPALELGDILERDERFSTLPGLHFTESPSATAPTGFSKGKGKEREIERSDDTRPVDQQRRRHKQERSRSQKAMLASALEKANTAVTLDNAENVEGAMEAYRDACLLLNQVMIRAGTEEDRVRLQRIVRHRHHRHPEQTFRFYSKGKS